MKNRFLASSTEFLAMTALASSGVLSAFPQASPLGQFDSHADIGSPKIAGSASYNTGTQTYEMSAAGVNMWGNRDEFHFAWKKLKGDFILQTRVEFIGRGVDPHRKLGWIARAGLDDNAPYADAVVHGDGLTSLQFRRATAAITEQIRLAITNADVIQFERKSNNFTFSAARFGEPFVSSQLTNLVLPDEVYVGLFLCSHNSNVVEKAVFRDVRVIRPARDNFVPYRDFIGSHLEILEVTTGHRQLIHSSKQPFEAPNWTPDGRALIYNVSGRAEGWGRLVRFDLATRQASVIDTNPNNRNNNDHVLSFDGTMLGLSDQSSGQSAVYTVPVTGGTPRRITPLTPSYLHSWSPDGKWLVYTGGRSNKFDIYKIPVEGGDEIRLTDSPGLNDGPEFSPDGKYIYFNSTRSGLMQLWRMDPDGKNQAQLSMGIDGRYLDGSADPFNNWFPHISPDGKWIAFLSFRKDVTPADHPYYKHVYLRLMPISGGPPKVIAYVYGGQGTINVPSWAPDSKRLAFVSNSDLD